MSPSLGCLSRSVLHMWCGSRLFRELPWCHKKTPPKGRGSGPATQRRLTLFRLFGAAVPHTRSLLRLNCHSASCRGTVAGSSTFDALGSRDVKCRILALVPVLRVAVEWARGVRAIADVEQHFTSCSAGDRSRRLGGIDRRCAVDGGDHDGWPSHQSPDSLTS